MDEERISSIRCKVLFKLMLSIPNFALISLTGFIVGSKMREITSHHPASTKHDHSWSVREGTNFSSEIEKVKKKIRRRRGKNYSVSFGHRNKARAKTARIKMTNKVRTSSVGDLEKLASRDNDYQLKEWIWNKRRYTKFDDRSSKGEW